MAGSCYGDSGGPLVFYETDTFRQIPIYFQIGIVSGNIGGQCGFSIYPDIYTALEDSDVVNSSNFLQLLEPYLKSGPTTPREEECLTVGGGHLDVPNVGSKCAIPFIYMDKKFHGCTTFDAYDSKLWCSVRVDQKGHHIGHPANWGHCHPSCPVDETETKLTSTTTTSVISTISTTMNTSLKIESHLPDRCKFLSFLCLWPILT